ncbi:uncharacterized protein LOC122508857 [Leptopilina heterotoma]|uniref:uncharacterized protein LOC122508857 n=1 Tax=Leptopilina heterotoma TaxID=63436 RepID=UPI001CA9645E|nr:uncharacterized protein LOC122508857 [Leptopilina heterotoma]
MLKHILTGQPSTGISHHHNDCQASGTMPSSNNLQQHHHHHHVDHYNYSGRNKRNGHDVYDSVLVPTAHRSIGLHQPMATTPSSGHHHPLNHSQLSVNNISQKVNAQHSHALNLSTLSTSKHSVNSVSPVVGGNNNNGGHTMSANVNQERPKINGGLDISRLSRLHNQPTPSPGLIQVQPIMQVSSSPNIVPLNNSWSTTLSRSKIQETGIKEMLTSLGLLCLVSLLLALLSLTFLLKVSPITAATSTLISPEEYAVVYQVTLALCALALSLNLCCLLVCAIQFLFAVKLVRTSYQGHRTNKYLEKSSVSRICAVGGFFISIPVFLTGMILYTFTQFHTTPAIVTSIFIALGIIFCGCAMVHNVFVWQREKTSAMKNLAREQCEAAAQLQRHQQNLQQQQLQQQHRSIHTIHPSCPSKIENLNTVHSVVSNSRGSHCLQQPSHLRHTSMSSPSGMTTTYNNLNISSHRSIPTTPPASPSNHSPTSPVNKHIRSPQNFPRELTGSVSPGIPNATLDLSSAANTNSPHELSTLV